VNEEGLASEFLQAHLDFSVKLKGDSVGELGYDIDQVLKREFLSYTVWNFLLTCTTALVSTPLLEIGAQYHQRSGSTTSTDNMTLPRN